MRGLRLIILSLVALGFASAETTGASRNLFHELLGKSAVEVDAKIEGAWQQLFHGNGQNQRVYYAVEPDLAYIADIGNADVRSEGMSYGLMIAVQLDRREEFDRLWRWTKRYMYHAEGPRRGYFSWHCQYDGSVIDPGSASDGEQWFAMALLFAAHRWKENPAGPHYLAEAQSLLRVMLHQARSEFVTPIFDRAQRQVVFAPTPQASGLTDPSYHLPAFYELWAQWSADAEDRRFWAEAAAVSRAFFVRAAHPKTGLMPEYAHFDGRPFVGFGSERGDFRFDAWRTLANVALDHQWFPQRRWPVEQSNRVLRFLAGQGPDFANQYSLTGEPLSTDNSIGLVAMAAVAGLAADGDVARPFVQRLWDAQVPAGQWRYYDGLLYLLGLLQVSGKFQIHSPAQP